MSRRQKLPKWCMGRAVREDIRTLWIAKDPELLKILENIRELEIRFEIRPAEDERWSQAA